MSRQRPQTRGTYPYYLTITTRWMDNDIYGHINNVVYYSYFDTVVNRYLIDEGVLDIENGPVIGFAVESQCNYFKPMAFPDTIEAGLRIGRLGTSSARFEIGLFRDSEDLASAQGHFVHVYVDRVSSRPCPIPESMRRTLEKIAPKS